MLFQISIIEALAEYWLEFRNRADDIDGEGDDHHNQKNLLE